VEVTPESNSMNLELAAIAILSGIMAIVVPANSQTLIAQSTSKEAQCQTASEAFVQASYTDNAGNNSIAERQPYRDQLQTKLQVLRFTEPKLYIIRSEALAAIRSANQLSQELEKAQSNGNSEQIDRIRADLALTDQRQTAIATRFRSICFN
jgi:uncharacterized membrane protein YccC